VAGACECGNEPSDAIKCGEFLDRVPVASLEGLCSLYLAQVSLAKPSTATFFYGVQSELSQRRMTYMLCSRCHKENRENFTQFSLS